MRSILTLAVAASLAACNAYDPNLPPTPFRCGATEPVCPSGYSCESGLCEETGGEGPDADSDVDAGCQDQAEPNDMVANATLTPVWGGMPMIQYEGLTLCPEMDSDFFRLTQELNCGTTANCPNLDVLAEFESLSTPPTVVVLNSTGTVVAMGGSTGTQGQVKAVLNNAAQGQYYVRVTSQAILPHYRLTIDGTRAQ